MLERDVSWDAVEQQAREALDRLPRRIERSLTKITPTNDVFGGFADRHNSRAESLWVLGRESEAVEEYRVGAWYRRWTVRLKLLSEPVELPLIGHDRTIVMEPAQQRQMSQDLWIPYMVDALMVQDWALVDLLTGFDAFGESYANAPVNPVKRSEVSLWRSLFLSAADVGERWFDASAALDAAYESGPDDAEWKAGPRLRLTLIRAVLEGDQTGFDQAVVAAHHHHVGLFQQVDSEGVHSYVMQPRYTIERTYSALINTAVRSGMTPPPQSPYFVDFSPWLDGAEPIAPEYESFAPELA